MGGLAVNWPLIFFMKYALPIVLLTLSNVFMMFAWYGHLKFKSAPLWGVIIVSWLMHFLNIAFKCQLIVMDTKLLTRRN